MKVNAILNKYQYTHYAHNNLSNKIVEETLYDANHYKITWNVNETELHMLIKALGNKTVMCGDKYVFKCCICEKISIGYGNNPAPVKRFGFCCDECNTQYVIPTRIANVKEM